jgi:hypothetical protein
MYSDAWPRKVGTGFDWVARKQRIDGQVMAAGATARLKRLTVSGDGPALIAALEKMATPR